MLVEEKMKPFIHKTDRVNIITDGLMGNKLINILPSKDNSPLADEGDILPVKNVSGTEEMLETLDQTNNNLAAISEHIKRTAERINQSNTFWKILESPDLAENLSLSAANIRKATERADNMVLNINSIINDTRNGKGSLGAILTDTSMVHDLTTAINSIKKVGEDASDLAGELSTLTQNIKTDITSGKGPAHFLLKDTSLVTSLHSSMNNIEQGTAAFTENMEALKHNFLVRGYFKKQEKKKRKAFAIH
jgi:phospholipid/cholesterol/gamma-HCH transport system substrate-binding protein